MNFPHLFPWVRMLLLTALAASGCLAASTTPSSMRLVSGDSISLVPVESPPLLAPSLGTQPVTSSVIPVLVAPPEGVLQPGGRILASVGGIIALVQIAAAGRSTGEPRTLEELLADPATWLPTRALADETAAQLSKGCSCSVATATQYVRLGRGRPYVGRRLASRLAPAPVRSTWRRYQEFSCVGFGSLTRWRACQAAAEASLGVAMPLTDNQEAVRVLTACADLR